MRSPSRAPAVDVAGLQAEDADDVRDRLRIEADIDRRADEFVVAADAREILLEFAIMPLVGFRLLSSVL